MALRKQSVARFRTSRTTAILMIAWGVSIPAVLVAHFWRPPAGIALTLTVTRVGFEADGAPLVATEITPDSVTLSGFDTLAYTPDNPVGAREERISHPMSGTLSVKQPSVETIHASDGARVSVTWDGSPQTVTVSLNGGGGTFRMGSASEVACAGCAREVATAGAAPALDWAAGTIKWTARSAAGGTDLQIRCGNCPEVRLSEGDVTVKGDLETWSVVNQRRVSNIEAPGSLAVVGLDKPQIIDRGAVLLVENMTRASLKELKATPEGLHLALDGRVERVAVLQGGSFRELLPSYLHRAFNYQPWLLLVHGVVVVVGTLTKVLTHFRGAA